MPAEQTDERAPLLPSSHVTNSNGLPTGDSDHTPELEKRKHDVVKLTISGVLTLLFICAVVAGITLFEDSLHRDPEKVALGVLAKAPVIVSLFLYRNWPGLTWRVMVGWAYWYASVLWSTDRTSNKRMG